MSVLDSIGGPSKVIVIAIFTVIIIIDIVFLVILSMMWR